MWTVTETYLTARYACTQSSINQQNCGASTLPPIIITISSVSLISGSKPRLPPGELSNMKPKSGRDMNKIFIFIIPCIVIFYGMTNRCNNVQWVYFYASPLYMFRAVHTPIIRSTGLTVSTVIGTIIGQAQIVSGTVSQCSLVRNM